jgi:hypothetical protein
MRLLILSCALASAAWVPLSAQAFCGFYAGKADANLFNEASQVVMVRDGKRTVISMLNDYKGPLSEFALVVPTPTALQKGQVRIAEKTTFERLDAYSAPRLAEYHDADPCQINFNWGRDNSPPRVYAPAAAAPMELRSRSELAKDKVLGVTVEVQYTLEEYDIVSLSATQSDGLETWLNQNGYKVPKGASEALKPYINQGMKFFVAKVNLKEQLKTGYSTLRPLQFAFESEKFMLPMRLGMLNAPPDKPQDLIIYMLTKNGRVESSNYRTVQLPANMNLPHFIKPRFTDFYKALFDTAAKREDHRVVFTEYFWDMAWCDPCAANPLSAQELRKAGAFWVGGNADDNFAAMQSVADPAINSGSNSPNVFKPAAPTLRRPPSGDPAQPVVLTRMHVRYTANTFPEDLMFTQTKDRQNWQTRYVVQNPYGGSVAQCTQQVGQMDCEAMCKPRVAQALALPTAGQQQRDLFKDKDPMALQRDCVAACTVSKQQGVQAATRYYEQQLPERINREKQTLAQLTGWGLADIDALPDARKYTLKEPRENEGPTATRTPDKTWWQKLFGDNTTR